MYDNSWPDADSGIGEWEGTHMVGGVGTIMAVLGGLIALLNAMNSDRLDKWFAIGAVLLFAGLLMRIEQAVRDKAKPGPRDVAEPGPQG